MDLRNFCKKNNLRFAYNENDEPIAPARSSKRFKLCHFYDGFSDGVGLWVQHSSASKVKNMVKPLIKMGLKCMQNGDTEKTFFVPSDKILEVAKLFNISKKERKNDGS